MELAGKFWRNINRVWKKVQECAGRFYRENKKLPKDA